MRRGEKRVEERIYARKTTNSLQANIRNIEINANNLIASIASSFMVGLARRAIILKSTGAVKALKATVTKEKSTVRK